MGTSDKTNCWLVDSTANKKLLDYLMTKSVYFTILYIWFNRLIGLVGRVFAANCPGDLGSIPGRDIPKTSKSVLDTSLLKTQHYKVRIKGKVEQSKEMSSALPYTSV